LYENNPTAREYLNQLYLSNFGSGYQPLAWIEYWLETHQHDIKGEDICASPPRPTHMFANSNDNDNDNDNTRPRMVLASSS